jgi:hypothetical protein
MERQVGAAGAPPNAPVAAKTMKLGSEQGATAMMKTLHCPAVLADFHAGGL